MPDKIDSDTADWIGSLPAPWHARVVTSAAEQLPREPGVVTAWVGGSLANGLGDIYSDVDLNLIVEDDTTDFWRTHWSDALERCAGRLILATDLGGPIIGGFALTEAWEHVDFIVHGRSAFQQPASSLPIYDSDDLLVPATTASSAAGSRTTRPVQSSSSCTSLETWSSASVEVS